MRNNTSNTLQNIEEITPQTPYKYIEEITPQIPHKI